MEQAPEQKKFLTYVGMGKQLREKIESGVLRSLESFEECTFELTRQVKSQCVIEHDKSLIAVVVVR